MFACYNSVCGPILFSLDWSAFGVCFSIVLVLWFSVAWLWCGCCFCGWWGWVIIGVRLVCFAVCGCLILWPCCVQVGC